MCTSVTFMQIAMMLELLASDIDILEIAAFFRGQGVQRWNSLSNEDFPLSIREYIQSFLVDCKLLGCHSEKSGVPKIQLSGIRSKIRTSSKLICYPFRDPWTEKRAQDTWKRTLWLVWAGCTWTLFDRSEIQRNTKGRQHVCPSVAVEKLSPLNYTLFLKTNG